MIPAGIECKEERLYGCIYRDMIAVERVKEN
jgi:hypothetical protein